VRFVVKLAHLETPLQRNCVMAKSKLRRAQGKLKGTDEAYIEVKWIFSYRFGLVGNHSTEEYNILFL